MTLTPEQETAWRRAVLLELARAARTRVRPFVPSKTLRRSLEVHVDRPDRGDAAASFVVVPYFWALYVHDGRGPFTTHSRPRRGRRQPVVLVWFTNPSDDPRTSGGTRYPRREKDIRQLTKAQYLAGLRENRRRRRRGAQPYMIVTKAVLVSTPARPFFDTGLRTFPQQAGGIVKRRWERLVKSQLIGDVDVARVRL